MRRVIAVLFSAAVVFAAAAGSAQAVFPGGNGKVAFSKAGLGGARDIWTVNADGGGAVNLTQSSGWAEYAPAWSPDRRRIAYVRLAGSSHEFMVMNANGSEAARLMTGCNEPWAPAWSPDGTKIAVSCRILGGQPDIWVVNVDGSGSANLTSDGTSGARDHAPAWSPDGSQVTWLKNEDVWKMSADGSGETLLVDNPLDAQTSDVTWSPNGAQIAFVSTRDCLLCNRSDIFKLQADGTGLTRLTYTPDVPGNIAWSPDGTKLLFDAFTWDEDGHESQQGLYTINADGSGIEPFGGDAGLLAVEPDWQVAGPPYADPLPEPGQIAFAADRDHTGLSKSGAGNEIYTMNPDGARQRRLTFNTWEDTYPAWSANGAKIAFSSNEDGGFNNRYEIHVMNSDGSGEVALTDNPVDTNDMGPTWSPDGTKIAFGRWVESHPTSRHVMVMNADGSGLHEIGTGSGPDWSPDGEWIAYVGGGGISKMRPDGSDSTLLATGDVNAPNWSPDGRRIAFNRFQPSPDGGSSANVWHMDANGGTQTQYTFENTGAGFPTWSPDGFTMAYSWKGDIWMTRFGKINLTDHLGNDSYPDWQAVHGYPRPKGATPSRFSLVTAYEPCTAPDREHGPPLAFGSCSSPQPASDHLTVGTGDANGLPARNEGHVLFSTVVGVPSTPADEADVRLEMFMDDVFTQGLADYAGELRASFTVRVTDKSSPGAGPGTAATTTDIPLAAAFSCTPVADPQEGSTCSGTTTVDALVPGAVSETKRSIWALDQVRVFDGGADGDADTTADNTLFATAGLFVP